MDRIFLIVVLLWGTPSLIYAADDKISDQLVADGMLEFEGGRILSAKEKFEGAARTGNAQAQTKLAEMYETGIGVSRSYVHAYAWYNVAAANGNVLAKTRRDALEIRMSKHQLAEAQTISRGISINAYSSHANAPTGAKMITLAYTFGLFSGEPLNRLSFTAYRPSATALQMVKDILSYNSIPSQSFQVVETGDIKNAAAGIQGSERYILYNPSFMRDVADSASTRWEAYSIMAHEIGHHLAGHTIKQEGSRPPLELQADHFSGGTLARMGASLEESISAINKLGNPAATSTHPGKDERVAAITKGWNQAKELSGGSTRTSDSGAVPNKKPREKQDEGSPLAIAGACVTPSGACNLISPTLKHTPCTCFTFGGMFPGVAQ